MNPRHRAAPETPATQETPATAETSATLTAPDAGAAAGPHEASTRATSDLRPLGIATLLLGGFLPMLDFFIVNVALPTIDSTLHASQAALELVVAGYGTAYALMLVVGGRLGDSIGRRRLFTAGLIGFTLTSLACGLAPTALVLIISRVLQGITAAMITPQVLATFQATLQGHSRSRAIGLYSATAGLASIAGQLIGGLLINADIAGSTWRGIFLVNVPVGVVALVLTRLQVPDTRSPNPASVDVRGTLLFGAGMIALLIPLTEGRAAHWAAWIWVLLGCVPFLLVALAVSSRRSERQGQTPLLPPSLLALRRVRLGLLLGAPFFMGFGAFTFVFALTVQDGLHLDALHSGLAITPLGIGFFVGSLLMARLFARFGRDLLTAGLGLQIVGLLGLVAQVSQSWPDVSIWALTPAMVVAGFGQSLALGTIFRTTLADVPHRLAGVGSGLMVTVQQGSLALGVATFGTLFVSLSGHSMRTAFIVVLSIQAGFSVLVALASRRLPQSETGPATVGAPQPEFVME